MKDRITRTEWERRTLASDSRFLVVALGGTIISHPRLSDKKMEPHPEPLQLFRDFTSIHEMAQLDFRLVGNVDSTNMKSKYWLGAARVIAEEQDNYDGILITHGTDTMAHTGAALRFLLGDNLRIPVVLTGSQLPLIVGDRSDARSNLGDSIVTLKAARQNRVNEVMIVFGHKIMRANRANKRNELDFDAFETPAYPELARLHSGEVNFETSPFVSRVDLDKLPQDASLPQIEVSGGFAPTPLEIAMNPDFEVTDELMELFERRIYTSIIMKGFGAGNVPDDIIPAIQRLSALGIPVLIGASHPGAGMNSGYAVGAAPVEAGAMQTGNMLSHTALIKLRWLQHRGLSFEELRQEMPKPYYGEVG
jgi:L-asparaginase